jgi:hypothetical protein
VLPWHEKTWCIPPAADAACVARREDWRELSQGPDDARRPVVCMDERGKQWMAETRVPVPVRAGQPARDAYEYARQGVCSLFGFVAPRRGGRQVVGRERRTQVAWAVCGRVILHEVYPEARCVRRGQENVHTPTLASLYEAFLPEEARRLALYDTPKHGSWLPMAETELGILNRQCRDRRLDNPAVIREEVGTWEAERHEVKATINGRFTVADARVKLKNVYPSIEI